MHLVIHPLVTHFSVTHFIPSLRTLVTQILLRVLYLGRYAVTRLRSYAFYTQPAITTLLAWTSTYTRYWGGLSVLSLSIPDIILDLPTQ